jgi:hypothetical protein
VAVSGPIPPLPFTPHGDDISGQISQHLPEMPWSAHLVTLDGAAHTTLRNILDGILTHTRLKKNEEYVQKLADQLIRCAADPALQGGLKSAHDEAVLFLGFSALFLHLADPAVSHHFCVSALRSRAI